jgi:hypothetical protein
MIPDDALDQIRRWADRRLPEHAGDQVRLEVDVTDRAVTILECCPPPVVLTDPPGGGEFLFSSSVTNPDAEQFGRWWCQGNAGNAGRVGRLR